jgi:hypothetical protein
MARIVVTGYLVRYPIGGYAWQAAHYLLGVRALGHDVWFYEDTGVYADAYDPTTNASGRVYDYGVAAAGAFLGRLGLGDRWVFVDVDRGREHGPQAGRARELLRDADLVLNVAGINRVTLEQRGGRPSAYVDIDPAFTQIRALRGDPVIRPMLDEQQALFTYGENIGTARSGAPDAGYRWHPTRPPIALELWAGHAPARRAYTTVGRWNETQRDLTFAGETFQWRKRTEWLRCLDLPGRTGAEFELAMDVENVPGDVAVLHAHGWRVVEPREVSADPWRYRDYIRDSRGEFTVAKELNVRLRSGWFSDRAACYLAAGRPVVEQDTGFGDVLPLGPGVHAFRTVMDAATAVLEIERDYAAAAAHASAVAQECFRADHVVGKMLDVVGL